MSPIHLTRQSIIIDTIYPAHATVNVMTINTIYKSAVIDKDLEKAVDNGIIRGAILDAHNDYKYKNANIILTGHSSSVSPDNTDKFNKFFGSQLYAFLTGKELQCRIPLK